MIKKYIWIIGLISLIGVTAAGAGSVDNDTVKTIKVAQKQKMLSQKISAGTLKASELKNIVHELEAGQKHLKRKINDPELANLLTFLDICIGKLESAIRFPDKVSNRQTIKDMGHSIAEGSDYIKSKLSSRSRANTFVALVD